MTTETLEEEIKCLTENLLEMAKRQTWNSISTNYKYILTEIIDSGMTSWEQRKNRKRLNDLKTPKQLDEISNELKGFFENIYDLNLYIYKAESEQTIIEIQFYPKSALQKDYFEKAKYDKPKLHCKITLPPYANDNKSKFDINWEHGGFKHEWKMFWWRHKTKNV